MQNIPFLPAVSTFYKQQWSTSKVTNFCNFKQIINQQRLFYFFQAT